MVWLRQGCAQWVVEEGREREEQEDGPLGPLYLDYGSHLNKQHCVQKHMTGKRQIGLLTPGYWVPYNKHPRPCVILTSTKAC